jgi:hypothetical protein
MDLLLQRGLPVRSAGSKEGQIKPGEVEQIVPQGYTPK